MKHVKGIGLFVFVIGCVAVGVTGFLAIQYAISGPYSFALFEFALCAFNVWNLTNLVKSVTREAELDAWIEEMRRKADNDNWEWLG